MGPKKRGRSRRQGAVLKELGRMLRLSVVERPLAQLGPLWEPQGMPVALQGALQAPSRRKPWLTAARHLWRLRQGASLWACGRNSARAQSRYVCAAVAIPRAQAKGQEASLCS